MHQNAALCGNGLICFFAKYNYNVREGFLLLSLLALNILPHNPKFKHSDDEAFLHHCSLVNYQTGQMLLIRCPV